MSHSSPSVPAKDWCGQRKKGGDGQFWISKPNKNGVCRWVQCSSKERSYLIHDNGGRPFRVDILSPREVKIVQRSDDDEYRLMILKD
jgi:hypothetical protein